MKEEEWIGNILFVITLVVYCFSSYPSLAGGDSGELLAEACQLGVAHPPGYPLYTILTNLISKVPLVRLYYDQGLGIQADYNPTTGWKMSQISTISGAGTVWMIYNAIFYVASLTTSFKEVKHTAIFSAVAGAISFGCMPLIWEYSISAEVFALNNFLCAWILHLTVISIITLSTTEQQKVIPWYSLLSIFIGAFASGLAFSNQHTSLLHVSFLILSVTVSLLLYFPLKRALLILIIAGISCLFGFLPYLHLFFAAKIPRKGSWGDTSNWEGLLRHVLRAEYGTFRLGFIEGSETAFERIIRFFTFTNEQMHYFPSIVVALFVVHQVLAVISTSGSKSNNQNKPLHNFSQQKTFQKQQGKNQRKNKPEISLVRETDITEEMDPVNKSSSIEYTRKLFSCTVVLLGNFIWYTLIWHGIFSNLPLSNPMAFGVHSRFWMQPNITLSVILGVMLFHCIAGFIQYLPPTIRDSCSQSSVMAIALLYFAFLIRNQWGQMNRNDIYGWTMHQYGENIIRNIPDDSILLSHTDLDLNPVRYIQLCQRNDHEKQSPEMPRKTIHHLSLQMMPYPWFETQQQSLYVNESIVFPNTQFDGVSTNRLSEGNARLITDFLSANLVNKFAANHKKKSKKYHNIIQKPRSIFLDMQAVNEAEIGSMGMWRGFILVPMGLEYLVVPPYFYPNMSASASQTPVMTSLSIPEITSRYHLVCWQALQRVQQHFPTLNDVFHQKFPKGSWEGAAMNVFYDAHYQLGLFYLTWVLDGDNQATIDKLGIILDRLVTVVELLEETWHAAQKYGTFSSSMRDLQRNTAVAYMRLYAILSIVFKVQDKILPVVQQQLDDYEKTQKNADSKSRESSEMIPLSGAELYALDAVDNHRIYLMPQRVREIIGKPSSSSINQQFIQRMVQSLSGYVRDHPKDEFISVFQATLQNAKLLLA